MSFKDELLAVGTEIREISRQINSLADSIEKQERKPAKRNNSSRSAIDSVKRIVRRSRKGVDTETLMKKTGFNRTKVYNTLYQLKAKGEIKSKERGRYITR